MKPVVLDAHFKTLLKGSMKTLRSGLAVKNKPVMTTSTLELNLAKALKNQTSKAGKLSRGFKLFVKKQTAQVESKLLGKGKSPSGSPTQEKQIIPTDQPDDYASNIRSSLNILASFLERSHAGEHSANAFRTFYGFNFDHPINYQSLSVILNKLNEKKADICSRLYNEVNFSELVFLDNVIDDIQKAFNFLENVRGKIFGDLIPEIKTQTQSLYYAQLATVAYSDPGIMKTNFIVSSDPVQKIAETSSVARIILSLNSSTRQHLEASSYRDKLIAAFSDLNIQLRDGQLPPNEWAQILYLVGELNDSEVDLSINGATEESNGKVDTDDCDISDLVGSVSKNFDAVIRPTLTKYSTPLIQEVAASGLEKMGLKLTEEPNASKPLIKTVSALDDVDINSFNSFFKKMDIVDLEEEARKEQEAEILRKQEEQAQKEAALKAQEEKTQRLAAERQQRAEEQEQELEAIRREAKIEAEKEVAREAEKERKRKEREEKKVREKATKEKRKAEEKENKARKAKADQAAKEQKEKEDEEQRQREEDEDWISKAAIVNIVEQPKAKGKTRRKRKKTITTIAEPGSANGFLKKTIPNALVLKNNEDDHKVLSETFNDYDEAIAAATSNVDSSKPPQEAHAFLADFLLKHNFSNIPSDAIKIIQHYLDNHHLSICKLYRSETYCCLLTDKQRKLGEKINNELIEEHNSGLLPSILKNFLPAFADKIVEKGSSSDDKLNILYEFELPQSLIQLYDITSWGGKDTHPHFEAKNWQQWQKAFRDTNSEARITLDKQLQKTPDVMIALYKNTNTRFLIPDRQQFRYKKLAGLKSAITATFDNPPETGESALFLIEQLTDLFTYNHFHSFISEHNGSLEALLATFPIELDHIDKYQLFTQKLNSSFTVSFPMLFAIRLISVLLDEKYTLSAKEHLWVITNALDQNAAHFYTLLENKPVYLQTLKYTLLQDDFYIRHYKTLKPLAGKICEIEIKNKNAIDELHTKLQEKYTSPPTRQEFLTFIGAPMPPDLSNPITVPASTSAHTRAPVTHFFNTDLLDAIDLTDTEEDSNTFTGGLERAGTENEANKQEVSGDTAYQWPSDDPYELLNGLSWGDCKSLLLKKY